MRLTTDQTSSPCGGKIITCKPKENSAKFVTRLENAPTKKTIFQFVQNSKSTVRFSPDMLKI